MDYAAEPEKSRAAMREIAERTAAEAEGVVVQLFSPVPSEEGEMLIMAHIKMGGRVRIPALSLNVSKNSRRA